MQPIYISSNSCFYKTLCIYREYIGYKKAYSFNQWKRLPDNQKVAALFVQFYNEITLAWYKVKTEWSIEEEGVEIINQYLDKNVSKILNDKKRFDPRYIYRVAYNCLYCLCIDPSKNKDRYYKEQSNITNYGEEELDLFDTIISEDTIESIIADSKLRDFVETLDEDFKLYISYTLGELTDNQLFNKIKKLGCVPDNKRNVKYRNEVNIAFLSITGTKLKSIFKKYLESSNYDLNLQIVGFAIA